MEKGIEYFQEAINMDPNFALAYTGIADCYVSIAWYAFIPPEVAYERAKEAAEKAVEIDDTVSEAHVSLANVKTLYYWDWEGAENAYKHALELNPSNAEAHHQYAHLMTMRGRLEDGVTEMKQALELEPLSVVINSCLGQNLYFAREYDAAIEQLQKAIEIDPNYYDPYGWLGMAFLNKGDFEQASALFQKGTSFPRFKTRMLGALGYAYADEGRRDEAENIIQQLKDLSEGQHVDPCYMAWIHAGLGEKETAFDWLDKGYKERSNWMLMLKVDPLFDSLHSDLQFETLLKKMGLD
jgi:tetratricopeptide (TPR) repeat protein